MTARVRESQSYAMGSRVRVKVRRITYPPWGPYSLPASSCNHLLELRASSSGVIKRRRVLADGCKALCGVETEQRLLKGELRGLHAA